MDGYLQKREPQLNEENIRISNWSWDGNECFPLSVLNKYQCKKEDRKVDRGSKESRDRELREGRKVDALQTILAMGPFCTTSLTKDY